MVLKTLVDTILKARRDPHDVVLAQFLRTLKRDISRDVVEAFARGRPLVDRYPDEYRDSPSFLSFLFRVCDCPLEADPPEDRALSHAETTRLLTEKETEVVELEKRMTDLEKKMDDRQCQLNSLVTLNTDLRKRNDQLESQLTNLKDSNSMQNVRVRRLETPFSADTMSVASVFPPPRLSPTSSTVSTDERGIVVADSRRDVLPVDDSILSDIDAAIAYLREAPLHVSGVLQSTLNALNTTLRSMLTEIHQSANVHRTHLTDANAQWSAGVRQFLDDLNVRVAQNLHDSRDLSSRIDPMVSEGNAEMKALPSSATCLALHYPSSHEGDLSQTARSSKDLILGVVKDTADQMARLTSSRWAKEMTTFSSEVQKILREKHEQLFKLLPTVPDVKSYDTLLAELQKMQRYVSVSSPTFRDFFIDFYKRMETEELEDIENYLMERIPNVERDLERVERQISGLGLKYSIPNLRTTDFEIRISDYIDRLQSQLIEFHKKLLAVEQSFASILQSAEEHMNQNQRDMVEEFRKYLTRADEFYQELAQKQPTHAADGHLNIEKLSDITVCNYPGITEPNLEEEEAQLKAINSKHLKTIETLKKDLERLRSDDEKKLNEKMEEIRRLNEEVHLARSDAEREVIPTSSKTTTTQWSTNRPKVSSASVNRKYTQTSILKAKEVKKKYDIMRLKKELIKTKNKLKNTKNELVESIKQNDRFRASKKRPSPKDNVSDPIETKTLIVRTEMESVFKAYFNCLYLKFFMLKYRTYIILPETEIEIVKHKIEILNDIKNEMRLNELTKKLLSYIELDIIGMTQGPDKLMKKIAEYSCETIDIGEMLDVEHTLDECMDSTALRIERLIHDKFNSEDYVES